MLTWSIPTSSYDAAVDAFLAGGAPMPEGVTALGRWHAPGSYRGWLLCATDDLVALSQHVAEWAPMLVIDVTPVIEDEQAGAAAAKARPEAELREEIGRPSAEDAEVVLTTQSSVGIVMQCTRCKYLHGL